MKIESNAPKVLATGRYIIRLPAVIRGIIFAGMILLAACGGDTATATPTSMPDPTESATATPEPTRAS